MKSIKIEKNIYKRGNSYRYCGMLNGKRMDKTFPTFEECKKYRDEIDSKREPRKERRSTTQGYIEIYLPDHPNANHKGFVLEHRHVMEQHIGRYLTNEEEVHHKDSNRQNNDASNLEVLSIPEHRAITNKETKSNKYKFDTEKAKDLYLQGYSAREVAKMIGSNKSSISVFVKREGITRPQMTKRDENGKFMKE